MCYLSTIVRASQNFEGGAWVSYDAAFRRQAANRGSLDWTVMDEGGVWASYDAAFWRQAANRGSLDWAAIDLTIYNEAFTGRAKLLPRCHYCLAETHETRDCQCVPSSKHRWRRWPGWHTEQERVHYWRRQT